MKNKKPKLKTVQMYHRWQAGKVALFTGVFACPTVPAAIITAINWDEWFNKSSFSLPFGFSCLLVTVVVAIVGILGSDVVFKKKDIMLFWIAAVLVLVGATNLFLANLLQQLGMMWIYTGAGLIGSGVCATAEKKAIEPKLALYKTAIEKNLLSKKSQRNNEIEKQAKRDAKIKNGEIRF